MFTRLCHRGHTLLPAFCFLLATGIAAAAGAGAVADISITPGQISWSPNIQAEKWLLTVSGQGIYLRQVIAAGEPLRLQPVAADGKRLTDGRYNWELRAIESKASEGISEVDERPASIRQRVPRREMTLERRAPERALAASGSFRVERGGFVMPAAKQNGEESILSGAGSR